MIDELGAVRMLLQVGRTPDEQYLVLDALGCLSPNGRADRMGVIRLLDGVYQAYVSAGNQPHVPIVTPGTHLHDFPPMLYGPPGSGELPHQHLARQQARALNQAGYLDAATA